MVEQKTTALPAPNGSASSGHQGVEPVDAKVARVYAILRQERATQQNENPISARELARRAKVRRSTCGDWLRQYEADQEEEEKPSHPESAFCEQEDGAGREPSEQNMCPHTVGSDDARTSFSSKE